MIRVTRAGHGAPFALNCDIIERVDPAGDNIDGETVITTVDGATYRVVESMDQVSLLVRDFRASILAAAEVQAASGDLMVAPAVALRVVPSED